MIRRNLLCSLCYGNPCKDDANICQECIGHIYAADAECMPCDTCAHWENTAPPCQICTFICNDNLPGVLDSDDIASFENMVRGGFVTVGLGTFIDACLFGSPVKIVEWIIDEMMRRKTPLTEEEMVSGYDASCEYSDQYPGGTTPVTRFLRTIGVHHHPD